MFSTKLSIASIILIQKFAIIEIFVGKLTHNFNIDFSTIFEHKVFIVITITIFQKLLEEMIK